MSDPLWKTQLRVVKGVLVLNVIIAILFFFAVKEPIPYIMGLLFGTIIVILNFRLLYLTLEKAVHMVPHKAQAYTASRYMVRYLVTGIVVYISIQAEHIHVLGTIAGLLSIKLVILKTELFNDKEYFKNIFKKGRRRSDGGRIRTKDNI
ncbi:hypothetical protein Amet_0345 [Alkaliphilus metalliredigens QYMF]|uniref:ATP synthase I n=1 Tax=Alkaliphilus metalliredigens (strain QYMF) TaxID=293826 RepID=A6TK57_ALKMQ|nr:ATP synthase subunit I [Alkaliphilus metalliredigens]ABR46575.1 hypothetical protein Amet_0345 [Alkaliphilus metalliredigens QYMF]